MTVRDSGEALLSVINDILDFSKIEAGKLALDCSTFDLRESLGDTMKSFALRAHQQGLELACFIHPEVPHMVVGDYNRLRQIVVNLVGNAIKFTDSGEVSLEVTRESHSRKGRGVALRRRRHGDRHPAGKTSGHLRDVRAGRRFDDAPPRRNGSGTGHRRAAGRPMGGRIWVESEVGRGSRFHFVVRLDLADNEPAEPLPPNRRCLHGMRVLVVDDNATNRRILDEVLRSWQMAPDHGAERGGGNRIAAGGPAKGRTLPPGPHRRPHASHRRIHACRTDQTGSGDGQHGGHDADLGRPSRTTCNAAKNWASAAYLLKPIKQSELLEAIELALGITLPEAELLALPPATASRGKPACPVGGGQPRQSETGGRAVGGARAYGHPGQQRQGSGCGDRAQKFDLVLMDVQMPEMDGLEATAQIRAREQQTGTHLPIIAMTAHALKGDRERCLGAGMDDYVAKPIRAEELFQTIDAIFVDRKRDSATGFAVPQDVVNWTEALKTAQGNRKVLKSMTEAALEEIPQLMTAIREALANGDHARLRFAAHTLKGSVRYFGADQVCEHAAKLEDMGRKGELADAEAILTDLESEIAQVTAAFRLPAANLHQKG